MMVVTLNGRGNLSSGEINRPTTNQGHALSHLHTITLSSPHHWRNPNIQTCVMIGKVCIGLLLLR